MGTGLRYNTMMFVSAQYSSRCMRDDLNTQQHVWFCYPDRITAASKREYFLSLLSTEEKQRYQRFHFDKDRHSYLVSHALVRSALSQYADIKPQQWKFTSNKYGKPEIDGSHQCAALRFNLTHTKGLSACLISLGQDCGIDVERQTRRVKLMPIAERMFAEPELAQMQAVDEAVQREKFFEYWTLREAYVKAIGTGLGGSSKQFYFEIADAMADNEKAANIQFKDDESRDERDWQFIVFKPSPMYTLSVAVQSSASCGKKILFREMTP